MSSNDYWIGPYDIMVPNKIDKVPDKIGKKWVDKSGNYTERTESLKSYGIILGEKEENKMEYTRDEYMENFAIYDENLKSWRFVKKQIKRSINNFSDPWEAMEPGPHYNYIE